MIGFVVRYKNKVQWRVVLVAESLGLSATIFSGRLFFVNSEEMSPVHCLPGRMFNRLLGERVACSCHFNILQNPGTSGETEGLLW